MFDHCEVIKRLLDMQFSIHADIKIKLYVKRMHHPCCEMLLLSVQS